MASNIYAIRIHEINPDQGSRLISLLDKLDASYVIAREHEANRPHFQGWIRTEMVIGTLRVKVKTAFPEAVGNKGYSLKKVKDFERYQRYTLKGTIQQHPDVVCMRGIGLDTQYVEQQYAEYWKQNVAIVRSTQTLIAAGIDWWSKAHEPTRRDLAKFICDTLVERNKEINVFKVRNIMNSIVYQMSPTHQEILLDEIVNKF